MVIDEPLKLNFENVLFVSGMHQADQEAFEQFLEFMKPFEVKNVHIITVNTSSYFTQPDVLIKEQLKEFKNIASEFNVTTKFYSDFQ